MRVQKRKFWYLYLLFCLVAFPACGANYYYCYHNKSIGMSAFDRPFVLTPSSSGRVIKQSFESYKFVRTFDEKERVTTVFERNSNHYKNRNQRHFYLYHFDLKNKTFRISSGYYLRPENFYKDYHQPYTVENARAINRNPDLARYLPQKDSRQISLTYYKPTIYECDSLTFLEYKIKFSGFMILSVLSI